MEEQFHTIPKETLLSQKNPQGADGDAFVDFLLHIPPECDFFDGHFPSFKLLPAVAQFAIVVHFAQKYFSVAHFVPLIKRIKFSMPILPNAHLYVALTYNGIKKSICFDIVDAEDRKKRYSQGSFFVQNSCEGTV